MTDTTTRMFVLMTLGGALVWLLALVWLVSL